MILGFKQYFPWKEPTNFREKIQASVGITQWYYNGQKYLTDVNALNAECRFKREPEWKLPTPKIHTMRSDPHNRWKEGMSIQMVYRGKNYCILDHFNKDIPELGKCHGIQLVNIINHASWIEIIIDDEKSLRDHEINTLVVNDGFENFDKFCQWFKKDFSGKIIHFTDFRY